MQSWVDWLDLRLDYRLIRNRLSNRILPNGPGWAYTSASCLLWLLVIQCFTGLLLMATYCPSMTSAWASVHFIDQTSAGRFLRGIHHYASHAMIILFGVHVLRVLSTAAYRAPRELVWITGLLLFPLMIVWTVTGNPLSVSQKGIAQIEVEGNILGSTPILGPFLRRLLFGGEEIGSLTLTRLYFLHVGLLPVLIGGLCFVHLHQVIKHSPYRAADNDDSTPAELTYWPNQTIRNMIALMVVVGIISFFAWKDGAPLHAPADPDLAFSPRPEWYFRWLFELRRYFSGNTEFIATMVIPSAFLLAFMAAPFVDRFGSNWISAACRALIIVACFGGWSWLTILSYLQDSRDSAYLAETAEFDKLSARALALAETEPITDKGAIELLRRDPQTQGPRLFARHCASCHSHTDSQGRGPVAAEPSAPNLFGIGTADWNAGFLDPDRIVSDDYFGLTKFRDGDMAQHVRDQFGGDDDAAKKVKIHAIAVALAAEAGLEQDDSALVSTGRELIKSGSGCTDCHRFHDQGDLGTAPDLTGYASASWLKQLISKPTDVRFYADRNDRMPEFASDPGHPELNLLSSRELDLLIHWLREPKTGAAQK
jgi:quinol-cytochrome oxidoreductase complex cytochrome b subunit/mono/diheme cytochrome c family protein